MSTILVSVQPEETRVGIVAKQQLQQYIVERNTAHQLVGSIFKGRVNNVVAGIQAAFIDLGVGVNAFLQLQEGPKVTVGQSLLVQVDKDSRGTKGPSVTQEITLSGRYLVLSPCSKGVNISKKITGKLERSRLREIVSRYNAEDFGYVLRTAAEGASEEELVADMHKLGQNWKVLQAKAQRAKAPQLLYREIDLSLRVIRDHLDGSVERLVVDNKNVYHWVQDCLQELGRTEVKLELYQGATDIFTHYQLAEQVESISDRYVELPCGGYLVIDHTEAMTVIDVNSGKYSAQADLAATTMEVNRQAAVEIAHQLCLRDIGGIIVIDFIDMHEEAKQQEIMELLTSALQDDKMKPRVHDITHLNLVEVTRKKARQNLSTVLYTTCPTCQGTGRVQSPETVGVEIGRHLRSFASKGLQGHKLLVLVHPTVAEYLPPAQLKAWEKEFSCSLRVQGDAKLQVEVFSLLDDGV